MSDMIYTTYFGKLKKFPHSIVPIAISRTVPYGVRIIHYPKLAPKDSILWEYKETGNWDKFTELYKDQIKDMCPAMIVEELAELAGTHDIALVCYEKSEDNCHRHILADHLREFGYEVEEF